MGEMIPQYNSSILRILPNPFLWEKKNQLTQKLVEKEVYYSFRETAFNGS